MKIALPRFLMMLFVTFAIASVAIAWTYYSMQGAPDFYQRAMQVAADEHAEQGKRLERQLANLSNQMRLADEWAMQITDDQINGWIASDLPEKFPRALPSAITNPRVEIVGDKIDLAFRFKSHRFQGIVHAQGKVFCTQIPNQIAFQISSVSSGIIGVPINRWADQLQRSLGGKGIEVRWTEIAGDPVALIDLPVAMSEKILGEPGGSLTLRSIQLETGTLTICGNTRRQMVHRVDSSHR